MITNVTRHTQPNIDIRKPASPTQASTQTNSSATSSATVSHTPFGDVLVDQLSTVNPPTVNLNALITAKPPTAAAPVTPPPTAPTPQSVFGPQPWVQNPTGSGPGVAWQYNPIYFATQSTAQQVAQMVGGKVVQQNMMAWLGGMQQDQPNLMVQLPDGKLINPGLVADFYNHGYPQSYINMMIQSEVQGVERT